MNKKQKKIVGQILFIANDKRVHVLKDDCILWMEEKMRIIRKLCKALPMEKPKLVNGSLAENLVNIKERSYRKDSAIMGD